MEVNIEAKGPILIVGMAISTLLKDVGTAGPALHAEFEQRKKEITNRINPSLAYAVSIDPPNYDDDRDEFRLVLGVEVDNLDHVPSGMESMEIPSSTYASVIKTGHSTFGSLMKWIRESDYELTDTYSIEVEDATKESVELMFPIQRKK